MKSLLFILVLVAFASSNPVPGDDDLNASQEHMKFFLYTDEDGNIQIEHLVDVPEAIASSASDVIYYYYSKSNPAKGVEIHSNNINALRKTAYSSNKDTLFIIHGWKNSVESDVNSHIREYILKNHDVNVFVVDWGVIAGDYYINARKKVQEVGGYVADFAKSLSKTMGLKLNKLKFVGHSLGAHVSGCAGAALNGQVDRIVGLDPAGPRFSLDRTDNRIDPTDAQFVQIIHTNDGKLGLEGNLGHADYYPNGGKSQAGCGVDLTGSCSHSRAYKYYAESLLSNGFVARECSDYKHYQAGTCTGGTSIMGTFNADQNARGSYYLNTNKKSPFAQG